ncbi:MAG: transposase, partial [Bacteroidota bacterium]
MFRLRAVSAGRVRFFTSEAIFKEFEKHLLTELAKCHCSAEAYLFMPDHCHLLLNGDHESSDVLKVVKRFKQQTGYWLSRNHSSIRWQKDFYDHIVSEEEDLEKHIRYVLENPVRMGLVEDWK